MDPAKQPDLPYVGLEHVERDTGRILGMGLSKDVRSSKLYFEEGDVLYARLRPNLNKVWRATLDGMCSTEFEVFRKLDGIESDFLALRLLSPDFVAFASALVGTSLYPRVRLPQLAAFEILLPPRPEQTRIAEQALALLAQADEADQFARAAAAHIHEYRRSILDDGVCGRLTGRWREENPLDVETAKVRTRLLSETGYIAEGGEDRAEPPLELLPETWSWARWGEIGTAKNGRSFPSADYVPDGVRLMRPGNLATDGAIRWPPEQTKYLPSRYLETHPDLVIREGDVIMNLTAQSLADEFLGRVCLAGPDDTSLLNQRLARLSAAGMHPGFLHYIFRSPRFRRFVDGLATGTVIQHISTRQLAPFLLPVPPAAEQKEIVRLLDSSLGQLRAAEQASSATSVRVAELRRSVLASAAVGRLVEQDPIDGDAATLLKTLSAEIEWRRAEARTRKRRKNEMVETDGQALSLRASLLSQSRELLEPGFLDASRYDVEDVSRLYEEVLGDELLLAEFKAAGERFRQDVTRAEIPTLEENHPSGHRFRLVDLWIENFKNLRDYRVEFDPDFAIDIVLGWNGTGKSNFFEALVIIFRDLHIARGKLPNTAFGYRIRYECGGRLVEVDWSPEGRRALKLKASPEGDPRGRLTRIAREELPLPRFVFGYYSGPTNRLAEHFLPLDREHYFRLLNSPSDSPATMVRLLEDRRFFCAYTHHAKYVMLGFFYKEDEAIREFLRDRLRIIGFRSAVFVIKRPDWARPGEDETTFWGATGIVRHFLERLRRIAVAPVKIWQTVDDGYKQSREEQLHFLIPDLESLRLLAAEYPDARSFFLALESTDFSRMVREVKVSVRVAGESSAEVPIVFREMSEGEQQLLTVLGLLRFTKAHDSLVLLDEPDTHLNPHWAIDYLELLSRIMGDGEPSEEERSSQILMSTHDPLVIVALEREQIHLLKRDRTTGRCEWELASESPRGLGFTGILTSEMFGFGSDLDRPTMDLLRTQAELAGKPTALDEEETRKLADVTAEIDRLGFKVATSDPYYRAFLQGVQRRSRAVDLMAAPFRDRNELAELARETNEILAEIEAEEATTK